MREFKFRAWETISKKMFHQVRCGGMFDGEASAPTTWNGSDWVHLTGGEYTEVMQYTGEHDDNGIEIYEGDIVLCKDYNDDEYTSLISYNSGAFTVDVNNYDYNQTTIGWGMEYDIESIKVIGNIYNNPELLEIDI